MKFMSFNTQHCLNYLEQKIDFQLMADTILRFDPDIVGLNEMRGEGTDPEYTAQTERLSELTGMKYYYFAKAIDVGGSNPYGNAILSKKPIISAQTVIIPDPVDVRGETRCVLKATFEDGLTVLVSHFGLNHAERVNAVKTVLELMPKEKGVLMGDFNASPDDKVLDSLREKLVDTADSFNEPKLSFISTEPTVKIDYIFVTPDVKVVSADIPNVVASDHRPHIAELEF
ncbi:MAG: endonuclease/exonuclease/phosphatase family protein [Clostridia bacterium]|nr:endonuclease/exonuclease/phosphatase family protein [Clostridia bacterium]